MKTDIYLFKNKQISDNIKRRHFFDVLCDVSFFVFFVLSLLVQNDVLRAVLQALFIISIVAGILVTYKTNRYVANAIEKSNITVDNSELANAYLTLRRGYFEAREKYKRVNKTVLRIVIGAAALTTLFVVLSIIGFAISQDAFGGAMLICVEVCALTLFVSQAIPQIVFERERTRFELDNNDAVKTIMRAEGQEIASDSERTIAEQNSILFPTAKLRDRANTLCLAAPSMLATLLLAAIICGVIFGLLTGAPVLFIFIVLLAGTLRFIIALNKVRREQAESVQDERLAKLHLLYFRYFYRWSAVLMLVLGNGVMINLVYLVVGKPLNLFNGGVANALGFATLAILAIASAYVVMDYLNYRKKAVVIENEILGEKKENAASGIALDATLAETSAIIKESITADSTVDEKVIDEKVDETIDEKVIDEKIDETVDDTDEKENADTLAETDEKE